MGCRVAQTFPRAASGCSVAGWVLPATDHRARSLLMAAAADAPAHMTRLLSKCPVQDTSIREHVMPFINVKIIEGVFTSEQKQEIARKLTDTMVSIEGENLRTVTWCVIEEVASGDWAIGGNSLTTEDVLALAQGQPVG